MKKIWMLALYGTFLGVLSDPGQAEPLKCASAAPLQPGNSPSLLRWKTRVYDELRNPDQPEADGYGVEISEEVRKAWDPLNGTGIKTRATCSRAFYQQNQQRTWLEPQPAPGRMQIAEVRPARNYLILQGLVGEKKVYNQMVLLNTATGERTTFASIALEGACYHFISAHPSPSGEFMASLTINTSCGVEGVPDRIQVDILDAEAKVLSRKGVYTINPGSRLDWISETSFALTDGINTLTIKVADQ
jgi:hypothetical protein